MNSLTRLKRRQRSGGKCIAALLTLGSLLAMSGISEAARGAGTTKSVSSTARGALPAEITPAMIEEGRAIFHHRGNCYRCHGKNGAGTFWAPALNDADHIHLTTASFSEIEARIRAGVSKPKRHLARMPPLGGADLNQEELRAVAAYVFTLDRTR